jgi:23S rRNA pseudouridine2605 synthase
MKRTDNFHKFVKQPKGSAIKEQIKQEKKKAKKERAEAIERHFAKKREERELKKTGQIPKDRFENTDNKPKPAYPAKAAHPKTAISKVATSTSANRKVPNKKAASTPPDQEPKNVNSSERGVKKAATKEVPPSKTEKIVHKLAEAGSKEQMPLNKYISHGGICSRRDAAILVKEGKVTVNGEVATDPGTKVAETDIIKVQGKKITPSRNFVYILLNKPKDYITTVEDPQGRRTVLDLVRQATSERVYPVGRLDRNTSGVLLLTNDGDLAQKLSHPKHEVKKIYEVKLDRNLTKGDLEKIAEGITLEDGFVAPDVIAYADAKDKSIIGIEIHSGRNRIVRRIFEHMKYDVRGLDRVTYAGLTKKNVQRGKWRFLSEKEVRLLKFMNQSFVKVKKEK